MFDSAIYQLLILFLVFYFILIRPQQKQMKKHQEMLNAIKKGDKVLTYGGLYATVVKIENEDEIVVQIADGVNVQLARRGVQNVLTDEVKPAAKPAKAQKATKKTNSKTKK